MRPSILLFKSYLSIKTLIFSGCFVSLLFLLGNCQWSGGGHKIYSWQAEDGPRQVLYDLDGERRGIALALGQDSCEPSAMKLATTYLDSPVGRHIIKFRSSGTKEYVSFDGVERVLEKGFPFFSGALGRLCAQQKHREMLLSKQELDNLVAFLSLLAPSCQLRMPLDGVWQCEVAMESSAIMEKKLTTLHKRLLRRFKRHPYLLLRRTTLAINLVEAIKREDYTKKLHKVCVVAEKSLALELPLAMQSRVFKETVCQPNNNQLQAAQWVLSESYKEVSTLYDILRKESYRGVMSIRIPRSQVPSRELWVVIDDASGDKQDLAIASCFHPLYPDEGRHQAYAELGLEGELKERACGLVDEASAGRFYRKYLFSSVASETEFPISNGRGKVLRLPKGQYKYTLKQNLQNFYEPHKGPLHMSQGSISWGPGKPNPVVKAW